VHKKLKQIKKNYLKMANVSNTQMNFATNTNINVNANVNVVSKEYYVKVPKYNMIIFNQYKDKNNLLFY
jgi:hypothetical protein